jgi:hypothetical protein
MVGPRVLVVNSNARAKKWHEGTNLWRRVGLEIGGPFVASVKFVIIKNF